MTGVERIAKERQRQIEEKGWTAEHDDVYEAEELLLAAKCYLSDNNLIRSKLWPFIGVCQDHSKDTHIRDLEKAGALIAAEIDRLERLKNKEG